MSEKNNQPISRVTRSKQDARRYYDRISRWYDLMQGPFERAPRIKGLGLLDIQNGEAVLEVGSGTGHGLCTLAQQTGPSGKAVGLDLSAQMARITCSRLAKVGLQDRARMVQGDAGILPFKSACFHAVFTSFTLELFDTPEIPLILEEFWRVLKDGGRLVVVAMAKSGSPNLLSRMYEWGHEKFPAALDCRPIYTASSLAEAGFTIAESQRMSLGGLPVDIILGRKFTIPVNE